MRIGLRPAPCRWTRSRGWQDWYSTRVGTVVVGMSGAVELALASVPRRGSRAVRGRPGLGKTLAARSLAAALVLDFRRPAVQHPIYCRPISPARSSTRLPRRSSSFGPGPVFTGLFLADEIKPHFPKTQSALLEAMAEGQSRSRERASSCPHRSSDRDLEPDRVRGHIRVARGRNSIASWCVWRLATPSAKGRRASFLNRVERRREVATVEP